MPWLHQQIDVTANPDEIIISCCEVRQQANQDELNLCFPRVLSLSAVAPFRSGAAVSGFEKLDVLGSHRYLVLSLVVLHTLSSVCYYSVDPSDLSIVSRASMNNMTPKKHPPQQYFEMKCTAVLLWNK
jgi:hypothetical protein